MKQRSLLKFVAWIGWFAAIALSGCTVDEVGGYGYKCTDQGVCQVGLQCYEGRCVKAEAINDATGSGTEGNDCNADGTCNFSDLICCESDDEYNGKCVQASLCTWTGAVVSGGDEDTEDDSDGAEGEEESVNTVDPIPWSMHDHDARQTARSDYDGPETGLPVVSVYEAGTAYIADYASPIIGKYGLIYVSMKLLPSEELYQLYAYDTSGETVWKIDMNVTWAHGDYISNPVVTDKEHIYFGSTNYLFRVVSSLTDPPTRETDRTVIAEASDYYRFMVLNGPSLYWHSYSSETSGLDTLLTTPVPTRAPSTPASPTILASGYDPYVADEVWPAMDERGVTYVVQNETLSDVYYIGAYSGGGLKWKKEVDDKVGDMLVDDIGLLRYTTRKSINVGGTPTVMGVIETFGPSGVHARESIVFDELGRAVDNRLALGHNGDLYVGHSQFVTAFSSDGEELWEYKTEEDCNRISSMAVDANDVIYYVCGKFVCAVNGNDGTKIFCQDTGITTLNETKIAIHQDGHVVVIEPFSHVILIIG